MSQQFSFIKQKLFSSSGNHTKNGSSRNGSEAYLHKTEAVHESPRKSKLVETLDQELAKLTVDTRPSDREDKLRKEVDSYMFERPRRPLEHAHTTADGMLFASSPMYGNSPESPNFNFDVSNIDGSSYHRSAEISRHTTNQDSQKSPITPSHSQVETQKPIPFESPKQKKTVFHRRHTSDQINSDEYDESENKKPHGKFRRIRHKMSMLEINFKINPKNGHSTYHHHNQNQNQNKENVFPLITRRSDVKVQTMSEINPTVTDSNKADVYSFNPAKKSIDSSSSRVSAMPFVQPVTRAKSINSTSSSFKLSGIQKKRTSSSFALSKNSYTPSITSTDDIFLDSIDQNLQKVATIQSMNMESKAVNRRRSRTVDLSDYVRNKVKSTPRSTDGSNGSSETRAHSLSFSGRSPFNLSRTTSNNQPTISSERNSREKTRSPYGTLTVPSSNSAINNSSGSAGVSSRRSSSIVNALSNFVNLKSNSVSSFKQVPFSSSFKQPALTLEDLPKPPEPEGCESYSDYLIRISPYGKFLGVILVTKDDQFKKKVLYHFLYQYFDLKYDSLDVCLRKILIFLELPKEAQEIDRLLTELGNVIYDLQFEYYNPCGWVDANQVYFVLFSLLVLHTDQFNPKNKFKMTKQDFIKLVHEDTYSSGDKVPVEILSYYYDNITSRESPVFDLLPPIEVFDASCVAYGCERHEIAYSPMKILGERTEEYNIKPQSVNTPPQLIKRPTSSSISSSFSHNSTILSGSTVMPVTADIDIYEKIFNNELREVSLEYHVSKIWDFTEKDWQSASSSYPSSHVDVHNKYKKFYSIVMELKGGYIRIHKNILMKLNLPNYDVVKGNKDYGGDYYYLKIIQMGEIQTFYQNRKIPIVGSVTSNWKPEYGILTYIGLIIFEKSDWITPQAERDPITGVTNYIIDFKPGFSFVSSSVECFYGMFAVKEKNAVGKSHFVKLFSPTSSAGSSRYTTAGHDYFESAIYSNDMMSSSEKDLVESADPLSDLLKEEMEGTLVFLHSAKRNIIFKCPTMAARDNWVDAINLVAAYDGCDYQPESLHNTLVCKKKYSIQERLIRLHNLDVEKSLKLHLLESALMFFRQAVPITMKTRNTMISNLKQIATKMDWLLFEIKRSQTFVNIISEVDGSYENIFGITTSDFCSEDALSNMIPTINGSFLFNE
ncbi:Arf guanine nucleotide exchange factor SYT1 [Nakaseomyces bracarensis]|uniref:Arf guanine nucleotide exchange factor SYT1 n=1 Tax=Nakaseomyces bracarensis TaxID=273131 RepID=A0ABR4NY52_9SACH